MYVGCVGWQRKYWSVGYSDLDVRILYTDVPYQPSWYQSLIYNQYGQQLLCAETNLLFIETLYHSPYRVVP